MPPTYLAWFQAVWEDFLHREGRAPNKDEWFVEVYLNCGGTQPEPFRQETKERVNGWISETYRTLGVTASRERELRTKERDANANATMRKYNFGSF